MGWRQAGEGRQRRRSWAAGLAKVLELPMVASQRIPTFEELYLAIEALPEGVTGEVLEPGMIHTMGRPGGCIDWAVAESSRACVVTTHIEAAADGGSSRRPRSVFRRDGWPFRTCPVGG